MSSDVFPAYRFYVQIDQVTHAVFTEVTGLQIETEVTEYAEGGNNSYVHRLPGRTKVSNITLKRGMTSSNELFKWYLDVAYGKVLPRRNVSVIMYDTAGQKVMQWNFIKAYPVKWVGPQLNAGGTNTAVESFELTHEGIQPG